LRIEKIASGDIMTSKKHVRKHVADAPCVRIVVAPDKFKYGAAMKEQSGKTRTRIQGSSVIETVAA
jgi:adenosine/AMP kinase